MMLRCSTSKLYPRDRAQDNRPVFRQRGGGHNAGIVSEPGHPRRRYRVHTTRGEEPYRDPDTWLSLAEQRDGSWWPAWHSWLVSRSGAPVAPPTMGRVEAGFPPLGPAPGTYVKQT